MERDKTGLVIVNVDCSKQSECPKSTIAGDGSCFELENIEIIVPFDSCIDDWLSYLNNAEPFQKCQLGHKRYRTDKLTKND